MEKFSLPVLSCQLYEISKKVYSLDDDTNGVSERSYSYVIYLPYTENILTIHKSNIHFILNIYNIWHNLFSKSSLMMQIGQVFKPLCGGNFLYLAPQSWKYKTYNCSLMEIQVAFKTQIYLFIVKSMKFNEVETRISELPCCSFTGKFIQFMWFLFCSEQSYKCYFRIQF